MGHLLRERGFLPRYDPTILINGKPRTPDWDVPETPRSPRFLCDVFTVNPEQQRARRDADIRDLTSRIGVIPLGVALMMDRDTGTPYNPQQNAATARRVERWLRSGVNEGSTFAPGGFTFVVIAISERFARVQFIAPVSSFWGDDDPLTTTIEEKVSKYRDASLPIVVAVFADFLTAVGVEEVQRAISGDRRSPGVFARDALSAVLWITRVNGTWRVRPFCNTAARAPLSEVFTTDAPV